MKERMFIKTSDATIVDIMTINAISKRNMKSLRNPDQDCTCLVLNTESKDIYEVRAKYSDGVIDALKKLPYMNIDLEEFRVPDEIKTKIGLK